MTLKDLAFSCFIYGNLTEYDTAYGDFLEATGNGPDLSLADHRQAMLTWLNKWGCRQFSKECHPMASDALASWHQSCRDKLPAPNADIRALTEHDIINVDRAYRDLRDRRASVRHRGAGLGDVTFGATGAGKILFALCPQCLPPWDNPIAERLKELERIDSYSQFVVHVRATLHELATVCRAKGFALEDLPARIGRPRSTLVKIVDEYYWVTITRSCMPADRRTLQQWIEWDMP